MAYLAYFFPTPLPTLPPGCVLNEYVTASGHIQSTCTYPTPTPPFDPTQFAQLLKVALPSYMQLQYPQFIFFLSHLFLFTMLFTSVVVLLLVLYLYSRFHFLIKRKVQTKHVLLSVKPTRITTESSLATEQLFTQLHSLVAQKTFWEKIFHVKTMFSVELVATRDEGIRYLIHTTSNDSAVIKKTFLSYLPGVEVDEVKDYLPETIKELKKEKQTISLYSFHFSRHFALPLHHQKVLSQHDPIAYLTGNMTKLSKGELVSLQLVLSPVDSASNRVKVNEGAKILQYLWEGKDIEPILAGGKIVTYILFPVQIIGTLIYWYFRILFEICWFVLDIFISSSSQGNGVHATQPLPKEKKQFVPTSAQLLLYQQVEEKLKQPLFEASMRFLVIANSQSEANTRVRGFASSLSTFDNAGYQQILPKQHILSFLIPRKVKEKLVSLNLFFFKHRILSFSQDIFLSASELSSLYHLPYTTTTKTEDLVSVRSSQFPAPLALKKSTALFDTVFAKNTYGNTDTPIGLTIEERRRHVYILGATGMGKTNLLKTMISTDMREGKGMCVIDPHGDLFDELIGVIPKERLKDVVIFNPSDRRYFAGLNLLSLPFDIDRDDLDMEKDLITSSVISIFQKLYPPHLSGPRMQHILRNAVLTALTLQDPTLFTVHRLITDTQFRKITVATLQDSVLKKYWTNEFEKLGDYQKIEFISPITNKIGRFLDLTMTRLILGQPKSTIDFDDIMNNGKILLCNLSKGKLGEDNSEMFGILLIAQLQLAALRRVHIPPNKRKDFFLYVDEFQNFATPSFAQILSEARKYRLNATLAHQTTSQIEDTDLIKIMLANVGTVICFRTANPTDEEFIRPIFHPVVEKGMIASLDQFHFYTKINSVSSENAFSGETEEFTIPFTDSIADVVISYSQEHFAVPKETAEKLFDESFTHNQTKEDNKKAYEKLLVSTGGKETSEKRK